MVPAPELSYFPSLDKCINGDQHVISWKSAFVGISSGHHQEAETPSAIDRFLSSPDILDLLSQPFNAFPKPSPQTKSAFETKTSAINVTPSPSAKYDIKEVKEDALWLSKEAGIDEISALRVVMVECQSRASSQLMGRFSDEEIASIQEAAGNTQTSNSVLEVAMSKDADPEAIQADFDAEESRRLRMLRTYLSERQYLLKCVEFLFHKFMYRVPQNSSNEKRKGIEEPVHWLERIGATLTKKLGKPETFLLQCYKAIRANVENIQNGCGWYKDDDKGDEMEIEWTRSQITEATHAMEIIFQILDCSPSIASSVVVVEWLRLVASFGFFNHLDIPERSVQALLLPLQSIATIISLSIFSVGSCIEYLSHRQGDATKSPDVREDTLYILSPSTITEIHEILMEVAGMAYKTAGPAVLAWSAILQMMKLRVMDHKIAQQHITDSLDDEGARADAENLRKIDFRLANGGEPTLAPDFYEDVVEEIMDSLEENPIDYLALSAVNGSHVFETLSSISLQLGNGSNAYFSNVVGAKMRIVILDLIRSSRAVGYIPEVVAATLSTLQGGQTYWDLADADQLRKQDDPAAAFLGDPELVDALFKASMSRYPFESLPFLKMVRAISACTTCFGGGGPSSVIDLLETVPTFTYTLPNTFVDYETTQEEENNNSVRLTRPVQLFESRVKFKKMLGIGAQPGSSALWKADKDFCLPAGTCGRIVSESGPKVAFWFHEYSGFKYLGKLLETFLTAGDQIDATTGDVADRDSVAEIVGLFATLLLSLSKSAKVNPNSKEDARRVLEIASSGLSRNRDITTVIFDIFEEELQKQSTSFGSEVPLEILVSCVQFVHALISISPGRVWPFVGRSGLLEIDRGAGRLSSIVASVEMPSGRYNLLLSCSLLFESLLEDFVTNAVRRKCGAKTSDRFSMDEELGTGVPDQVLSKVLVSFTRYLVDVLESYCTWKFVTQNDRQRLSITIAKTFDTTLGYVYGIDSTSESSSQLMGSLAPAASQIVDSFLSTSSGTLRFQPLLRALYDGFGTPNSTMFLNEQSLWTEQVTAILSFFKTLLRVSSMLDRPPSQLERQLFKASPLVARLYAVNDAYQIPVVELLKALIVCASNNAAEPPSLLGHLGPYTSKRVLHILSNLDKPLSRDSHVNTIWNFLSVVVSSRQQWFASFLLTGKNPRTQPKDKACGKTLAVLDEPLLNIALDELSNIGQIKRSETLSMLEFVALAQNFWPWTMYDLQQHTKFIKAISEFAGNLTPVQSSAKTEAAIDACCQTRIAAYIAEILAMHLFHARRTGNTALASDLIPNLSYFTRFAVAVPSYNSSLHGNLKRNFDARYVGCGLRDFRRTGLSDRQYGREYFYDMALANKMLSFDQAWIGRKDDGYGTELGNANVNLSLVDTQIALLHGWKFLAVELSSNISHDPKLQQILAKVATDCLVSNTRSQTSEEIFTRLIQTRADFALVLIQRLAEAKSTVPEMQGLLSTVWEAIRGLGSTFGLAIAEGDATYYRSLLKMLFLSLRIHGDSKPNPPEANRASQATSRLTQTSSVVQIVLEILERIVAQGLRDVASVTHDNPADSSPEDIALLTGILQACLRTPGIEFRHPQIVSMMVQCDTARVATTLFSWSDSLAINGDPVYGELSILFLLELSSMSAMAEQLAIDGILGHIASTNIASYLRRGNVSPFADGAGLQRCYNIWVKGILPLLLNLLDAVGASISTEVSLFLDQFPSLLQQSSKAFEAPGVSRTVTKTQTNHICLSLCSEVHSLSLMMFILNGFKESVPGATEVPDVKWDVGGVLENVEFWLGARTVLRERILPMGPRDVEMARTKIEGGEGRYGAVNKLEERVVSELIGIRDVLNGGDS